MNYRQFTAVLFVWFVLRFAARQLFGDFYYTGIGVILVNIMTYGGTTLLTIYYLRQSNLQLLPTAPLNTRIVANATFCIFLQFLVESSPEVVMNLLADHRPTNLPEIFATGQISMLHLTNALLIAPVFEELFFRGILLQGLARKYGFRTGAIVTSLLFALMHIEKSETIKVSAFFVFLLSLFLSWIFIKTLNIKLVILLHFAWNALIFVFPLILKLIFINDSNFLTVSGLMIFGLSFIFGIIFLVKRIKILSIFFDLEKN